MEYNTFLKIGRESEAAFAAQKKIKKIKYKNKI